MKALLAFGVLAAVLLAGCSANPEVSKEVADAGAVKVMEVPGYGTCTFVVFMSTYGSGSSPAAVLVGCKPEGTP